MQNLTKRVDSVLGAAPFRLTQIGTYATGVFDDGAAEIVTYDPLSQRAFFSNANANSVGILDLSDPTKLSLIDTIELAEFGGGVNSLAVANGIVAVAIEADEKTDSGVAETSRR